MFQVKLQIRFISKNFSMKIKSAEFIKGVIGSEGLPDDEKAHIAFVGRSNVGKSSVINSLLGTKNLVKSSSKPGCTKEINFFLINERIYFVDLPGYGYAKIAQKQREKIRRMVIWYMTHNKGVPKKTFLIVDANVGLKEFDRQMIDLLKESGHNFSVIANKVDKVKSSELFKKKKNIKDSLEEVDVIFYSAVKNMGRGDVLERVSDVTGQ